ncbi:GtrA family protein [Saprospiraceae bacterium]|nr:GtrA family protein [Bacteroidota bacterium]MDB4728364.1 GtrA family protein [Saprospiraceae bacterium]MDF1866266.1 GtrA family protein [Saprospiraceae bacterium]
MSEKTPFWKSFYRSQFASIVATAADFIITIFLTQVSGVWYVISNYCGALTGAIISFLLGRNWAFNRTGKKWEWQALRYGITSFMSVNLNTYGVWLLTENLDLHYTISKIIIAILIGVCFNFPMFRYFVFK